MHSMTYDQRKMDALFPIRQVSRVGFIREVRGALNQEGRVAVSLHNRKASEEESR